VKRTYAYVLISITALVLLFQVSRSVEDISHKKHRLEVLYLPSGQFMEQASLGYKNLAADILWFKTVQYYGGYRMGENDLALFKHLVEVITDLDPQFVFAYQFGALIIAEDLGYFEEGIEFLEKGMWNNPTNWWMPFELGFLHYVDAGDYETAARYFRLASQMPGAGEITRRFAAFVVAKAGHIETSIAMWKELARTTENEYIREIAGWYIEKLEAQLEDRHMEGE